MTAPAAPSDPTAARLDRFLRSGGVAVLVFVLGAAGLNKSTSYYGTLLRGFDAQFYYAAARSMVVGGNVDVTDDLPASPAQGTFKDVGYPRRADGGIKNVFPVGLSLVEAPFLGVGRAVRPAGEGGPPGYSRTEIRVVAAGLLLVAALGMQILYGFVRRLAAPGWALLAVLAAWFGTPLLYYTAVFPFTAHPTAFTLMLLLLWIADRIPAAGPANREMALFGLLSAAVFLTRPQEAAYAVILAAFRAAPRVRTPWRQWLPGAAVGVAVCAAAVLFQAAVHRVSVGEFRLVAQGTHDHPAISAHFDWLHPHFDVVLWSASRGLLWVTPVVVVALAGYARFWRQVPWWGWAVLANAVLQTAIVAAWSDPWLGDAFGVRTWCEHVPVVACGLALWSRDQRTRRAIAVVAVLCALWTLVLMAAYARGQLLREATHRDAVAAAVRIVTRK